MSEELSIYERALAKEQATSHRKKPGHKESDLQMACKKWFCYQYPNYRRLLFSVPNGGRRDARTGAILKAEGVEAGVSDMILLMPNGTYSSLCIEMKTPTGKQSAMQKEWQHDAEREGNKYAICRSLDEFQDIVNRYLRNQPL